MDNIINILESLGFSIKLTSKPDELRICCPFCVNQGKTEDTKYHLYINTELKLVHCFRCNYGGTLYKFLNNIQVGYFESLNYDQYSRLNERLRQNQTLKVELPFPRIDEYDNIPVKDHIIRYLKFQRRLTERDIHEYDLKVGLYDYSGRVIIPIKEEFVDVYFTGRSLFSTKIPKYKNPALGEYNIMITKSEIVYNLDAVNEDTECIAVMEGPFDAIATSGKPYPSVALLGKSLTKYQLFKLLLKKPQKILVAFDADAHQDTLRTAKLFSQFIKTSALLLRNGDPAVHGESYLHQGEIYNLDGTSDFKEGLEKLKNWKPKSIFEL